MTLILDLKLPEDLARLKLPRAVDARLGVIAVSNDRVRADLRI